MCYCSLSERCGGGRRRGGTGGQQNAKPVRGPEPALKRLIGDVPNIATCQWRRGRDVDTCWKSGSSVNLSSTSPLPITIVTPPVTNSLPSIAASTASSTPSSNDITPYRYHPPSTIYPRKDHYVRGKSRGGLAAVGHRKIGAARRGYATYAAKNHSPRPRQVSNDATLPARYARCHRRLHRSFANHVLTSHSACPSRGAHRTYFDLPIRLEPRPSFPRRRKEQCLLLCGPAHLGIRAGGVDHGNVCLPCDGMTQTQQ